VTLALGDGSQKRYPNEGAFVLIGADPPVQWLEKMGIHFVQRPHQYQLGKTDDIVRRYAPRAAECPEDAARAAAQVLGGSTGKEPTFRAPGRDARDRLPMPMGEPVSGPRKWLRSATSIFSIKDRSGIHPIPTGKADVRSGKQKKFEAPVPLSEFAKRGRAASHHHTHTGHGRRDQLSAGERTRILRMLRDEGGRMADEESQVFVGMPPAPKQYDFDFDDDGATVQPAPVARPDVPAKPAVVVGLAQARRQKRSTAAPPPPPNSKAPPPPPRAKNPSQGGRPKAQLPKPFEEPTRAVGDAELLAAVRNAPGPGRNNVFDDQPTRLGNVDARLLDAVAIEEQLNTMPEHSLSPKFLNTTTEPQAMLEGFESADPDEATRMANLDGIASMERANRGHPPVREERTRAVDIRNDPSMSDVDWDID
jgi:hypothetical protein